VPEFLLEVSRSRLPVSVRPAWRIAPTVRAAATARAPDCWWCSISVVQQNLIAGPDVLFAHTAAAKNQVDRARWVRVKHNFRAGCRTDEGGHFSRGPLKASVSAGAELVGQPAGERWRCRGIVYGCRASNLAGAYWLSGGRLNFPDKSKPLAQGRALLRQTKENRGRVCRQVWATAPDWAGQVHKGRQGRLTGRWFGSRTREKLAVQ